MRSKPSSLITIWARPKSIAAIATLGASLWAPSTQAAGSCYRDADCWDGDWSTLNWCHEGECQGVDRHEDACSVTSPSFCLWDHHCDDGNAGTVNWCQWDWFSWGLGTCYAAPVDASACEPAPEPECLRNRDCRDGDPSTRNWCFEGQCYEVDRSDAACQETGRQCRRASQCRDGDRSTVDWCYRGSCYHAPKEGGVCEPACEPSTCPDDNNPCTQAACDDQNACTQVPVENGSSCDAGQCLDGACVECVADTDCGGATNCTQAETCVDNVCQSGAPVVCEDDGNLCTVQSCDPASGCVSTPVQDGTACGDGQSCQGGTCVADNDCPPVEVVIDHSKRGSVNNPLLPGGLWKVIQNSYQIRWIRFGGSNLPASSNYHCFDLSGVQGTVLDARLEMKHSGESYDSADPAETVVFRDIENTPCDDRYDNAPTDAPSDHAAIFQDLNDGAILAQFEATASDNNRTESFGVTPAGLTSLRNAAGGAALWGIGGGLSTADRTTNLEVERVFRGSNDTETTTQPPTKLILTVQPASCEPQPVALTPDDLGYYLRGYDTANQQVLQSFHFESPAQEHKLYPIGNHNLNNPFLGTGNIERRAYFVFNVANVSTAVSAKLRIWGWQPSQANVNSGVYSSPDPSETVGLFEVQTPASEVIGAPFNDKFNHQVDVPIWTDLGDGLSYGERVFSLADATTDLVPSPTTDPNTDCTRPEGGPCGKWLEFDLNANAIAAINAASGQWTIGAALTTIDETPSVKEWTNNGVIVDLSPSKSSYPDYLTPEPQLIIQAQ